MSVQHGARAWLVALTLWVLSPLCLQPLTNPTTITVDAPLYVELPKLIALTFDDGPRRATTIPLLNGLAERDAKATFFVLGQQISGQEDILLTMSAQGHEIGLHTFDHVNLTSLSLSDYNQQIETNRQALATVLDDDNFLLRPPYGLYDQAVLDHATDPIILWSVDPEDWSQKSVTDIVDHVVSRATSGDIVLMHDIFMDSVTAALNIVDQLQGDGFTFVTVSELFSAYEKPLEDGMVYTNSRR